MTFRCCLLLLAALAVLKGATLRGTVVERQTGKPLARALVAVHPVAGSAGATRSVRTNNYGAFEFNSLTAGPYTVAVARKGFFPVQYGQRDWNAAGMPVTVQEGDETVLRIALPRYGVITGRISDEADVGLPDHEVLAYRNMRPPVLAAHALTDDRGVYRIFGLEPGTYLVRTGSKQYEENGYLPTFYKETPLVDAAYSVQVALDRETPDVNVRPTPGRLFEIAGQVFGPGTPAGSWRVSLISDMGIETVTTDESGRFRYAAAAPGKYEILAESPRGAGWLAMEVDRNRTDTRVQVYPIPNVEFTFENGAGGAVDNGALQLMARRKQLWGPSPVQYVPLAGNRARLSPGRWEFSVAPNPSYYTHGWTEAAITSNSPQVKCVLWPNPGSIHGTVTTASGDPSVGAPVYLEGGEVRTTRTDIHGVYSFVGLAPGEYRVVSTFDVRTEGAGQAVKVEVGQNVALDLMGQALAPAK